MRVIARGMSRAASLARKAKEIVTPTATHRKWVDSWAVHGGEREMDVLDILADPDRAAIDVGANSGVYTSRLAALCPQVIAIEPNPDLCAVLRRARYPNVRVVEAAVSDHAGAAKLHIPILKDGHRSLPCATLETLDESHPTETINVRVVPLDDYAAQPVGFVKIDIEGHEGAALRGARNLFESHRPRAVVEVEDSVGNPKIAGVLEFFSSLGYETFFLRSGEIHPVDSFDISMQDRSLLDKAIPRRESAFVNNFIFLPGEIAGAIRDRIATRLDLA